MKVAYSTGRNCPVRRQFQHALRGLADGLDRQARGEALAARRGNGGLRGVPHAATTGSHAAREGEPDGQVTSRTESHRFCGALALAALLDAPPRSVETTPSGGKPDAQPPAQTAPPPDIETVDVFDVIREIRHKELTAEQKAAALDPSKKMTAFAPIIGYKPTSGVMVGVGGNVAFFGATRRPRASRPRSLGLTFSHWRSRRR